MALHRITKGLQLPITGDPVQRIDQGTPVSRVAIMADDSVGMRPTMQVKVNDPVKRGQLLFEDKKMPGVRYTAFAAGKVIAINRGDRRALQSVVIELSESECQGKPQEKDFVCFDSYPATGKKDFSAEDFKALLVESGMWTALRARPFGRVANPEGSPPHSIFVTAMDTNPLAPSTDIVIEGREEEFKAGLLALSRLTEGKTYLCLAPGAKVSAPDHPKIQVEEFSGVHPAGTVGVHIHLLDPVCREKTVWYLGYQDVIAMGVLLRTGRLDVQRIVALGGPSVKNPRLLRTRLGASIDELVEGQLIEGTHRVVSGSVLSGRKVQGEVLGYLGRYHQQISVLPEGTQREFLGWMAPGLNKFSTIGAYLSCLFPKKKYSFTTNTNGSKRAIIPIGMYERVLPMDLLPTFLLRSLAVRDIEQAEQLGCLELEEEDVSLCTFVCPGKQEYGPMLREVLTEIEKEG